MSVRGALTGLMDNIRNCKFEVVHGDAEYMTTYTGAGKEWHV